jgi:hypothetical protein
MDDKGWRAVRPRQIGDAIHNLREQGLMAACSRDVRSLLKPWGDVPGF